MNYDDHDLHVRLLGLYVSQVRSEDARRRWRYDRLPWWRKLVTRRPKMLHGGYTAVTQLANDPQSDPQKPQT